MPMVLPKRIPTRAKESLVEKAQMEMERKRKKRAKARIDAGHLVLVTVRHLLLMSCCRHTLWEPLERWSSKQFRINGQ
jgi:hypothetical protein